MKRIAWALCLVFLFGSVAHAKGHGKSHGCGDSLTDLMKGYLTFLVGVDPPTRDGKTVFLPLPAASDDDGDGLYEGEIDVTLMTDEAFALTMYVWYGELYEDDSTDDWDFVDPDEIKGTSVLLKLDGKTLIDSSDDDMSDWYFEFDDTEWENPVYYAEPSSYGSIAAIWAKGLGFEHKALSKGQHTMELWVTNTTYGGNWHNVWNIDVKKAKKK